MLRRNDQTKGEREAYLREHGYPSYTTSAGWLGYSDDKLRQLCRAGLQNGWTHFKQKVGRDLADDVRRARIICEEIGPDRTLMMDANHVWDVDQAINWMRELVDFNPLWIEEPTSPDDLLGHARIADALAPFGVRVATGEHCQNRTMFKQFMQARAPSVSARSTPRDWGRQRGAGGADTGPQVRHTSVSARRRRWPVRVCPAPFDGRLSLRQRVPGWPRDRVRRPLHDHFVDPVVMRGGRYLPPTPGYSAAIRPESLEAYAFPHGPVWRGAVGAVV
jgi:L-fuconate dehydratase